MINNTGAERRVMYHVTPWARCLMVDMTCMFEGDMWFKLRLKELHTHLTG